MHVLKTTKHWPVLLGIICLIGLTIRLYLVMQSNYKIDYDEAMIALNSRHLIYEGTFNAFVPGQATLGNIEAYLLAPFFLLFGANAYSFRLYSIIINLAFILSTAYLGREAGGQRTGLIAGLFAAAAPAYMQITGLKTWGATIEILLLGNLVFLGISKLSQNSAKTQPSEQLWAVLVGIAAGLMFWNSWLSFYYFLPLIPIGLWKHQQFFKWLPLILFSFVLGSLPLWIHNYQHNMESFQTIISQTEERGVSRIATAIKLLTEQYPTLITGFSAWSQSSVWANIIIIGSYSTGILAIAYHSYKSRNTASILSLGLILTIPIIYIQSGYGRSTFNNYGVDSTGRYLLMIHSVLPIGIGLLAEYLKPKLRSGLIILLLIANLSILPSINLSWAFDSPYYNRQPQNMQEIINYLLENDHHYVWTDIGIAQPLMFLSEEQIIAADYHDFSSGGIQRFEQAFNSVLNAEDTVYLVAIIPNQNDTPLSRALDQEGIHYETHDFGTSRLYIPAEKVHPERVILGLGLQY